MLAEDSPALVGLAIASVGIALSHGLQMPALDGAASVLTGLLLAGVAGLLAWQSRGLLIRRPKQFRHTLRKGSSKVAAPAE